MASNSAHLRSKSDPWPREPRAIHRSEQHHLPVARQHVYKVNQSSTTDSGIPSRQQSINCVAKAMGNDIWRFPQVCSRPSFKTLKFQAVTVFSFRSQCHLTSSYTVQRRSKGSSRVNSKMQVHTRLQSEGIGKPFSLQYRCLILFGSSL